MASSSIAFCRHHSHLARREFSSRTTFDLGGFRLAPRRVRRGIPDRPYGTASAPDDDRSSFDLSERPSDAFVTRFAATFRAIRYRSPLSLVRDTATWACALTTCPLLARGHHGISGLAYSRCVYARIAIGSVARRRTRVLPRGGISLLVARNSALAERPNAAHMVNFLIPFPGHAAVRHPLRISFVLRPCR